EADFTGFSNSREIRSWAEQGIFRSDLHWLASLRARAGIGIDRTLFHATLGIAIADFDRSFVDTASATTRWHSLGRTKVGVIGGIGIERALTDKISARFEGLLACFEENEGLSFGGDRMLVDDTVAMARFGLNYRFGSGAKAAPYAA